MKFPLSTDHQGWNKLVLSVFNLLGRYKTTFIFWNVLLIIVQFYTLVPPLILGKIVDFFTNYSPGENLTLFYIYVVTLSLSFAVVSFLRLTIKKRIGRLTNITVYLIRTRAFNRLVEKSMKWHEEEPSGNRVQKIQNGANAFRQLMSMVSNDLYLIAASVIGTVLVFAFLNTAYVIFFLFYIAGCFAILRYFYKKMVEVNINLNKANEQAIGRYVESVTNMGTIKSLGVGGTFIDHIEKTESQNREQDMSVLHIDTNTWRSFHILNGISYFVFMVIVGQGIIAETISLGSVIVFFGYLEQLMASAARFMAMYAGLVSNKTAITRLMEIFEDPDLPKMGKKEFPLGWKEIRLQNVSLKFTSVDKQEVQGIKSVSITIPKGSSIGFVGKTGSGKSTISKILLGLYEITEGDYFIDDTDFYDFDHNSVARKITVVPQQTDIFNMSLVNNITLMRNISPERLFQALKIADLHSVIEKMPAGLDTRIGSQGFQLSGGERQRVGIARAACSSANIIIFDEATSALDAKTEKIVQQNLDKFLKNKTKIFIAHRVQTLEQTDAIYVFERGKIVESGTYDNLRSNKKSKFYLQYLSS